MKLFKLFALFAVVALLCSTAEAGPLRKAAKKIFGGAKKVASVATCNGTSCSR
jgi:hypothetical protein